MNIPVYGFENTYTVNEFGQIFSNKTKQLLVKAPQASLRQDRYRLSDKKYYDLKYLVYKSFHLEDETIQVNDDRIIFKNGNCRDYRLENLVIIDKNDRNMICSMLSIKYGERIVAFPEYKNYYISENGNVYSYYHAVPKKIKTYIGTDGYYQVKIPDNFGADVHIKIHRWVALFFVDNPNPNEFNVVNHKDENKLNNNYLNLEWTTLAKNTVYSMGKKCCMLDENNCILSIHDSVADLSREYRVDSSTASKQCNGRKNQFTNGYKARFFDALTHNFIPTSFD